ncbi:MAG: hypothetical protein V2I35_13380 [Desulfocapsaceae bacterium]|jgi:hypothetical protein|nr:hypothetical protein [Desulfocapsaceae bacterium]
MTETINTEICDGCGKSGVLFENEGNEFCSSCRALVEAMKHQPGLIRQLCRLTSTGLSDASASLAIKQQELPEVLDAVRYRTHDREQNTWYVSVSEIDGAPVEIFASTAFDRDQHLQSRISNLTTITRLISLILRHVFLGEVLTLEKTLKQILRSSRQKNDLPDMLARILSKYREVAPGEKDTTT